jgi:hypothetical protein
VAVKANNTALKKAQLRNELQINEFFRGLHELLPDCASSASDFRPFDYFQPGEVTLSRIIADLLDPQGSHNQGAVFLKAFLSTIECESDLGSDLDAVKVEPEDATKYIENDRRRMDITLRSSDFVLGIENKPWAREQPGQVSEYVENLRRETRNRSIRGFRLVYLCGDRSTPTSLTIEEIADLRSGKLLKIREYWNDLGAWLVTCEKECPTDAQPVRSFLQFFRQYVGAQREAQMIADYVLQEGDQERLSIALEVADSCDAIKDRLIRNFGRELERDLKRELTTRMRSAARIDNDLAFKTNYSGLRMYMPKWAFKVSIETQSKGSSFIWGVENKELRPSEENLFPELAEKLNRKFGSGKRSRGWEWYMHFDPPFGDRDSNQVALKIHLDHNRALELFSKNLMSVFDLAIATMAC